MVRFFLKRVHLVHTNGSSEVQAILKLKRFNQERVFSGVLNHFLNPQKKSFSKS